MLTPTTERPAERRSTRPPKALSAPDVTKLMAAIDATTGNKTPLAVARALTELDDETWTIFATGAGMSAPGETIRGMVIGRYMQRAMGAGRG